MNGDDVIDSRDLQEKYEELQAEFVEGYNNTQRNNKHRHIVDWNDDTKELDGELQSLHDEIDEMDSFIQEINDYGDYEYGTPIIRDYHFEDYCQEMLKDSGDIPDSFPSYITIDWSDTAENLKADYVSAMWGGNEYYIRT